MRRSDQRRDAVFASYQRDVTGRPLEELVAEARPLTRELAEGVEPHREELDEEIAAHAKGWALERIAPLELQRDAGRPLRDRAQRDVPHEVAIDEAVEIAKEYCGADAPGFVNGVLGAIVREREGVQSDEQRLGEISARLQAIAAELEGSEASDERAAELAREAAELSAEAVEEANRRMREAAQLGRAVSAERGA